VTDERGAFVELAGKFFAVADEHLPFACEAVLYLSKFALAPHDSEHFPLGGATFAWRAVIEEGKLVEARA